MTLTLVHLLPELLGTYGDRGNVEIASWRLSQRGIKHEVLTVGIGDAIPTTAELYFLGGGEDDAQIKASQLIGASLLTAVNGSAHIFAVCAGFQLLGVTFPASGGRTQQGLEIVPIETVPATKRSVGEILSAPSIPISTLTGFENHAGQTRFLQDLQPLGKVLSGVGNGLDTQIDGLVTSQIVGTYMHGPAFARNPELADWILSRVVGDLAPLHAEVFNELHNERVNSVK
jgi:lipid II isoglutaminyl synthase (glutamine-hydrolysing)